MLFFRPFSAFLGQKIAKNYIFWLFWCQNQENEGFKILDSGNPKFSRRRPTQPSRPVVFKQETAFHLPINPIFGPARCQIYEKMRPRVPSGAQMLVSGAFRCQKPAFPKLAAFQTHPEAIPNPFWSFLHKSGTVSAIFGSARGQIWRNGTKKPC